MIQGFVKIPFTHFKRRDVCVVDGQYMHQFVVLCVYIRPCKQMVMIDSCTYH